MSLAELFAAPAYGPAPEDGGPARSWIASRTPFGHQIGGEEIHGERTLATLNPATGEPLADFALGTDGDVEDAIAAARNAFPEWSADPERRARVLYALSRMVQRHARLFATVESLDVGKPIRESRDLDVPLAARHFLHHAGWALEMERAFPGHEALGVVGAIIPWNFPLLILSWKVAPALAAGNTMVLKPAEDTPLTALLFAEMAREAGLPDGVLNVVTGDGATGRALVRNAGVDKITFTGSTEVGKEIARSLAGSGRRFALELGGKSPYLIFDDADLDAAVEGLVDAIWFNGGQVCCAGSRLLVQEPVAERVLAKVRARMAKLRVGDPLDKAIDVGAMVSARQRDRVAGLVAGAERDGGRVERLTCDLPNRGFWHPPTLVTDLGPAAEAAREEIFGPVLVAMPFRTHEEGIALANNTAYGLAATVWTRSLDLAHDVASRLKAGTVWINSTNLFDAASGLGGYRESGQGREGGRAGMREYLRAPEEPAPTFSPPPSATTGLDRTHKLYIGGKGVRADGGYSVKIGDEEFARANRKDVREAVEAAIAAGPKWASDAAARAQVLWYLAENLEGARGQFSESDEEFRAGVRAVLDSAARADKWDGEIPSVPMRAANLLFHEPLGVIGIVLSDGFYALMRTLAAAVGAGNTVVVLASENAPRAAAELYRVLDASDVPGGVVNILTGPHADTLPTLADHEGVDGLWIIGAGGEAAERAASGNLKRLLVHPHPSLDQLFRAGTQGKNVWIPYGA